MNHFNPDVTNMLFDPDLGAQSFKIRRYWGKWELGKFLTQLEIIDAYGNIQPASARELRQLPEGDRINGAIVLRTTKEIFLSSQESSYHASDEILWNGKEYKVIRVNPWSDFGFHVAYLTMK